MSEPVLYHGLPNGPSLTVLVALEESGISMESRAIRLIFGERHTLPKITQPVALDYSVEGEGPVIVSNGEAMTDSVFLAQYLDEAVGGCGLQPSDPYARWQMLMWCRQVTERLAPAAAYLGNLAWSQQKFHGLGPDGIAKIVKPIRSEDLRRRWQDLIDGVVDAAKVEDSKTKVRQFVDRVEKQLADGRDWLIGEFSIADLETFAWLHPMTCLEKDAFEKRDHCGSWMRRVLARASVETVLDRVNDGDPVTLFAPGPEINRWG